jgi:Flp pilus assembly protein TadD
VTEAISKLKSGKAACVAILAIILATLTAYHNSLSGPFVFDDIASIRDNPTLRRLWPLSVPLAPPVGNAMTVTGRPVLNLSLALNYAFGGLHVWGYHAANLAIHICAALALFGIVRRTLEQVGMGAPPVRGMNMNSTIRTDGRDARPHPCSFATLLAFAVALIWAVHPLQTEAVTYVVQRAESLMGLFYLLTFYCFIRGAAVDAGDGGDGRPARWFELSVLACLLGMLTKEVMVTAPVMVWLYDRTFVSGTFRGAWRQRRFYYSCLAGTWLALVVEMAITGGNRGSSAGFGSGARWWPYLLTQFPATTEYLRLSFWPHPLVFDYGTLRIANSAEILPNAIIVFALLGYTIWALVRRPRSGFGFLGAWFFGILAPTSLVPGTTQMIVEHRMYLPLAAVVVCAVLMVDKAWAALSRVAGRLAFIVTCLAVATAGIALVIHRNETYGSELSLWNDTVAKRPENARAWNNIGIFLLRNAQPSEAIEACKAALRIDPDFPFAENNLGIALVQAGRPEEAIGHYRRAIELKPDYAEAENNLGIALARLGRMAEALAHYQAALRLKPDYAECHYDLGNALVRLGRLADAVEEYSETLRLAPDNAEAHCNLGSALLQLGQIDAAIAHYEAACRIDPGFATARANLEMARRLAGRH